jgi:hypothetical protein
VPSARVKENTTKNMSGGASFPFHLATHRVTLLHNKMGPITRASARWAVSRAFALPEFWALVAEHSGLAGAWRLTGVCRASRVGAKVWLRTLPGLVMCGGWVTDDEG